MTRVVLKTAPVTRLVIDEIHPSLNEWARRWYRYKVADEKRRWTWMVRLACSGKTRYRVPVVVTVTYFFPDRRARDFDNYTPKFILDGIRGALLPDDSQKWIAELRIRFDHDRERPRTEITLHPT